MAFVCWIAGAVLPWARAAEAGLLQLTLRTTCRDCPTSGPDVAAQQRHMVPAPRLQMKDAQGEQRDVLQGLLTLQDADVSLPLSPGSAPCRLSR